MVLNTPIPKIIHQLWIGPKPAPTKFMNTWREAHEPLGFKYIFSRQIEAVGNKGDIAIAITTSGNSANLIEASKVAREKKLLSFCLSGNNGGKLKKYVDYPILIPSKITSQIQVCEIFLGQIYCGIIEDYT